MRDYNKAMKKHVRTQGLRKASKHIKRRQKNKKPRRKDWIDAAYDELDELEFDNFERIMPIGERERRRHVEEMAGANAQRKQNSEELSPSTPQNPAQEIEGLQGLVVEVSTGLCLVDLGGETILCSIRGSLTASETGFTNVVAVGDKVLVNKNGSNDGVVEAILPRSKSLARPDVFYTHLRQVVAANVDQVLVVASWREPHLWLELIDRYLIASELNDLTCLICINKIDLVEDHNDLQAAIKPYHELDKLVILTSARNGTGIDKLREVLRDRTTVLAGLSGVGKTSLLNALHTGLQLRTRQVSTRWSQGRHTTTQSSMLSLEFGGFVVDTPGIREFGLAGVHRPDLADHFPEMAHLINRCQFTNCTHLDEPECAIRKAVANGVVAESRYHSYQKIYATLPE
jgi:ribosome biogenesis GTPase